MAKLPDFFNSDEDLIRGMHLRERPADGWYKLVVVKQMTQMGKRGFKWPQIILDFEALADPDDPRSARPIGTTRPRTYLCLPWINPEGDAGESDELMEKAKKSSKNIGKMTAQKIQTLLGDESPQPCRWRDGELVHDGNVVTKAESVVIDHEVAEKMLDLFQEIWTSDEPMLTGCECFGCLKTDGDFQSVDRMLPYLPHDAYLVPVEDWLVQEGADILDAAAEAAPKAKKGKNSKK